MPNPLPDKTVRIHDAAVEALTIRDACRNCGQPVHTTCGPKRGWIHTFTDLYRCGVGEDMAYPVEVSEPGETARDESYNEGYRDGLAAARAALDDCF